MIPDFAYETLYEEFMRDILKDSLRINSSKSGFISRDPSISLGNYLILSRIFLSSGICLGQSAPAIRLWNSLEFSRHSDLEVPPEFRKIPKRDFWSGNQIV